MSFVLRALSSLNVTASLRTVAALARRPSLLVPHARARSVVDVDFAALRRRGYVGVVFDKDNTLSQPLAPSLFDERVERALRAAQREFGERRVVVFSNSVGLRSQFTEQRTAALERAWRVRVVRHDQRKPGGADDVLAAFDGDDDDDAGDDDDAADDDDDDDQQRCRRRRGPLVCVGDRLTTDVLFGNLNGMYTVLTAPLVADHPFIARLRRAELALLHYAHDRWRLVDAPPAPIDDDNDDNNDNDNDNNDDVRRRRRRQ